MHYTPNQFFLTDINVKESLKLVTILHIYHNNKPYNYRILSHYSHLNIQSCVASNEALTPLPFLLIVPDETFTLD